MKYHTPLQWFLEFIHVALLIASFVFSRKTLSGTPNNWVNALFVLSVGVFLVFVILAISYYLQGDYEKAQSELKTKRIVTLTILGGILAQFGLFVVIYMNYMGYRIPKILM